MEVPFRPDPFDLSVVAFSSDTISEEVLSERLRNGTPAVLARVQVGRVLLDLRTVFETQDTELLLAVREAGNQRALASMVGEIEAVTC